MLFWSGKNVVCQACQDRWSLVTGSVILKCESFCQKCVVCQDRLHCSLTMLTKWYFWNYNSIIPYIICFNASELLQVVTDTTLRLSHLIYTFRFWFQSVMKRKISSEEGRGKRKKIAKKPFEIDDTPTRKQSPQKRKLDTPPNLKKTDKVVKQKKKVKEKKKKKEEEEKEEEDERRLLFRKDEFLALRSEEGRYGMTQWSRGYCQTSSQHVPCVQRWLTSRPHQKLDHPWINTSPELRPPQK